MPSLDFDTLMEGEETEQVKRERVFQGNMRAKTQADLDFSVIRVLKTAAACKICNHAERAEIDRMIYRQRMGVAAPNGIKIDLQYVLDFMGSVGLGNPNAVNIRNHFGPNKHTDVPSREEIQHTEKLLDSLMAKLSVDDIATLPRSELLDVMMRQGVAEAAAKLRVTGKSGITVEHLLKIAEIQIREKGSEAQNEFLRALGGGVASAFRNGLPDRAPKQIKGAEVIDAIEPVEEEIAA